MTNTRMNPNKCIKCTVGDTHPQPNPLLQDSFAGVAEYSDVKSHEE